MDTYREAAQIRAGGSAGNKAGGRQRQAFEPTPGRTNAEKLQAINEFEDIIQKEFNGNADKCYKCQKYGHFANKCTEESEEELVWECSYCDREFTTKFGCIVHEKSCSTKTSTKKGGCYRCGRDGHYSSDCYASRHVKGYEL